MRYTRTMGARPERPQTAGPFLKARELVSLEKEMHLAEQEVAHARGTLEKLERGLRAMTVEAEAARDPRQFRSALAPRSPGAITGPVGFCVGLGVGAVVTTIVGLLLGG
jgi:hypothetical protein